MKFNEVEATKKSPQTSKQVGKPSTFSQAAYISLCQL